MPTIQVCAAFTPLGGTFTWRWISSSLKKSRIKGGFSGPDDVLVYIVKGGAKHAKLGEKGVFLAIFTNIVKNMMVKSRKKKTLKKNEKKSILSLFTYLKSICLGCILKVLLRGWYSPQNTSGPPGLTHFYARCKLWSRKCQMVIYWCSYENVSGWGIVVVKGRADVKMWSN